MRKYLARVFNAGQEIVGINQRNLAFIHPSNPRKYFYLADDKAISKALLADNGVPVPETFAIIERAWEIDEKLEAVASAREMVIKPSNGSGGNGILILRRKEPGIWQTPGKRQYDLNALKLHIASILYGAFAHEKADKCIIEQKIEAHPVLHEIYPDGIADIRVILYNHRPLMAMLRVPTDRSSGKANLHQGAIGVGVDLDHGVLKQGFYRNRIVEEHPNSGKVLNGIQIPFWEEMVNISVQAAKLVPLKYLGVDIIIDKNKGPLVIEINARPGLQIQNANRQGIWDILKETNE